MKTRITQKSKLPATLNEPWVDRTRRVYCDGDTAYVPVKDGEPYDIDLPDRHPGPQLSYQKLGDTIIIHTNPPTEQELNALLEWEKPACVLLQQTCEGVMRIPKTTTLYGTPHDVTFTEAGITYTLNPAKIMFSQGNRNEKLRIRTIIRPGEKIADMFAGIGYFTLSAAKAGGSIHAMEINPESYRISIDSLGKVRPETRNAALANMLEVLDVTENRYSGIPTIRSEFQAAGLPAPIFAVRRGEFVVTFKNDSYQSELKGNGAAHTEDILEFCSVPRTRDELQQFTGFSRYYTMAHIVKPLLDQGLLKMTIPEKPKSREQKFIKV